MDLAPRPAVQDCAHRPDHTAAWPGAWSTRSIENIDRQYSVKKIWSGSNLARISSHSSNFGNVFWQ